MQGRRGEPWTSNLAVREWLRANPLARERYSNAKRQALESGSATLLACSAAKQPALTDLLEDARAG